jgi:hypothetical protein
MAAGTSTPVEAGQGPSVLGIAASIGAKIRDAAEDAKEQREKAAEKGETPKKGSLFKSALGNQFNPVKSKKAKSNWSKQFDWNKTSKSDQQVKPPSGDGGGDSKGKLKEFIAGGFTAILKDTGSMESKLDGVKSLTGANLSELTRSSSTLTVIKDSIDAQTELRKKALEEAKFARAEKQLEKTRDVAGVSKSESADKKDEDGNSDGDGDGGDGDKGGFDLFGTLLGGLEGVESIMQIRNMLTGGKAAAGAANAVGGAAQTAGGIGAGAGAAIVGGAGLALSGIGEGMFQLGKGGDKSLKDRRKSIDEKKAKGENTFLDEALQVGQTGVGEIGKTLGVAMDVGGAPFRYAIEALRNPFLSSEQKEEQAENLAKMDTRIREHSRGWMNRIDFMNVIPDQKGGFGNVYGNEGAKNEMTNKMAEGGIVDNPTETMLNPGDSVIPLNRNAGKKIFGEEAATSPEETAMDTVGAMILGVSAGMLGKTNSGTVGDQVKQDIRKASKQFGISNLTFTSSIGKGQFGAVDTQKDSKDFLMSLFDGMKIAGGGGGGGNIKKSDDKNPSGGAPESLKADLEADIGKNASQMKEEIMQSGAGGIVDPTQQPWCAAYVNSQLKRNGIMGSNSAMADSYENWGAPVDKNNIKYGDVLVGDYGGGSRSHAMFAAGPVKNGVVEIIGGNQSGVVSRGSISVDKIDYARRASSQPPALPTAKPAPTAKAPTAKPAPNPDNRQSALPEPTSVDQVAQSGMVGKPKQAQDGDSFNILNPFSWGKAMDAGDKARKGQGGYKKNMTGNMLNRNAALAEAMKQAGMAKGGSGKEDTMRRNATQLRSRKSTEQRTRLGVQKVDGRYVNMGVSDQAVGIGPWWKGWDKKNDRIDRQQKQETLSKSLAERLNREEGLNKPRAIPTPARPSRPSPGRSPGSGGGTRPTSTNAASSGAIAVMPPAAPKVSSASAEGSFGSAVPAGKTSAMVFADFLYADLV